MQFSPVTLTAVEEDWRRRVRLAVAEHLPADRRPVLGMTGGHDPDFSRSLGTERLAGMAIPASHGGQGGSSVERFVVTEELLAAGAPITAHWGSDRQIGPNLVAFGTAEQRDLMLPRIVRGELFFSLGMSEPDVGSDLASVRTLASRVEGGWRVNGTKIWTSYADRNDYFMVLCRTSKEADRHAGLSQLIVDLHDPGVAVRPIACLDPQHHFHEVVLTEVFVPDSMVLGDIGAGWSQVTSELTLERAGPDRYMSVYPLLQAYVEGPGHAASGRVIHEGIGALVARLWMIRHLSLSTSRTLDSGGNPAVEAALVKDLGSSHEQEIVAVLQRLHGAPADPDSHDLFESLLAEAVLAAPSYTIRGGTVQILRSVAVKGLRVGGPVTALGEALLQETLDKLLVARMDEPGGESPEGAQWSPRLWDRLAAAGIPWVGVAEEAGGSGGEPADVAAIIRIAAYRSAPVPLAECLAGAMVLAMAGQTVPTGPLTIAADRLRLTETGDGWRVTGVLNRVPWGAVSDRVVCLATDDRVGADPGRTYVIALPRAAAEIEPGRNLADEPRDRMRVDGWLLDASDIAVLPGTIGADVIERLVALITTVKIGGACQAATDLALRYAGERVQFGQPIRRFQAVQHLLVSAAAETALATMAGAVVALAGGGQRVHVAAARVVAARAARSVAEACHQIHGAIGMTQEYPLHRATRRLWSWADEGAGQADWAAEVGQAVVHLPPGGLWSVLTSGPAT